MITAVEFAMHRSDRGHTMTTKAALAPLFQQGVGELAFWNSGYLADTSSKRTKPEARLVTKAEVERATVAQVFN